MDTSLAYGWMELGKPKLNWSLKLARQVEDNRKVFLHKCIDSEREAKESVGSLLSEIRDLVTREKWVQLTTSLSQLSQIRLIFKTGRVCGSETAPAQDEDRGIT